MGSRGPTKDEIVELCVEDESLSQRLTTTTTTTTARTLSRTGAPDGRSTFQLWVVVSGVRRVVVLRRSVLAMRFVESGARGVVDRDRLVAELVCRASSGISNGEKSERQERKATHRRGRRRSRRCRWG